MDETIGISTKQLHVINKLVRSIFLHSATENSIRDELYYLCRLTRAQVEQEAAGRIENLNRKIERLEEKLNAKEN